MRLKVTTVPAPAVASGGSIDSQMMGISGRSYDSEVAVGVGAVVGVGVDVACPDGVGVGVSSGVGIGIEVGVIVVGACVDVVVSVLI